MRTGTIEDLTIRRLHDAATEAIRGGADAFPVARVRAIASAIQDGGGPKLIDAGWVRVARDASTDALALSTRYSDIAARSNDQAAATYRDATLANAVLWEQVGEALEGLERMLSGQLKPH